MRPDWPRLLGDRRIVAAAPCRVDMGGTLDIAPVGLALPDARSCTVNLALGLHTTVTLEAGPQGRVELNSQGFETASFPSGAAPFRHPLGLMFAVAAHFGADGVRIRIASASPPRSALGGSSVAAVALVAAFAHLLAVAGGRTLNRSGIVLCAHAVEAAVAGVPCGLQDQLAAAFGGVNCWHWQGAGVHPPYRRQVLVPARRHRSLARCLLVAYGGRPHVSADVNACWVEAVLAGRNRPQWVRIAAETRRFAAALGSGDLDDAAAAMNAETAIRREMTPDVLDATGQRLVDAAVRTGCGARFTGAGGGGCVWALGAPLAIAKLKQSWQDILSRTRSGCLLPVSIDRKGLSVTEEI